MAAAGEAPCRSAGHCHPRVSAGECRAQLCHIRNDSRRDGRVCQSVVVMSRLSLAVSVWVVLAVVGVTEVSGESCLISVMVTHAV